MSYARSFCSVCLFHLSKRFRVEPGWELLFTEFSLDAWTATRPARSDLIALDDKYTVWHALENEYWPALYPVDAQGHVRYNQFGEGKYAESERIIQKLLTKSGAGGFDYESISANGTGAEASADWANLKSGGNSPVMNAPKTLHIPAGRSAARFSSHGFTN
ncbi:MAG: hypothetical protein QOI94_1342 [Acidobacteriaceae bacterium]|nr:hypothetical protein [Acidobacteriaceae bacterium]